MHCQGFAIIMIWLPISYLSAFGQSPESRDARYETLNVPKPAWVSFIENRGQWTEPIEYLAQIPGGEMYLERNRITYKFCDFFDFHDRFFHSPGNEKPEILDCHAIRLEFIGANQNPLLIPEEKSDTYHNYFLGSDPEKWAGAVPLFHRLRYEDIYPKIDLQLYGQDPGIKYDLILSPGADASAIAMQYSGTENLEILNGALHILTSVNKVIEEKPYAFQWIDGYRIGVSCIFVQKGMTIGFEFPDGYDKNRVLIIDPTLIFSTYTGSTADNFGYTATYDDQGNLYAGGVAFGAGVYPTTVGAFQTAFQGGGGPGLFGPIDISITKFNPSGTAMVYSTYLGGNQNEQPHSMIVNANGELCVYARTWSPNFPVTATAFDQTANGLADIAVTVFNPAGTGLIGSTYVGGSGDDAVNISTVFGQNSLKHNYGDDARGEIMLDDTGDIYVTSCTQSANFPVTAGCAQAANAGMQDAVVFKMNPTLSTMSWGTHLGGSNQDAGYSVKVDATGGVFVAGGTASTNFPVTASALFTANQGNIDGFVTHLNSTGTTITASTYVGTIAYDQAHFLELDNFGDVYIYGQSLGAYLVTGGVYSNPGSKQFIHKMSPGLGATNYSTVFGSGSALVNISPSAFLVDICGYIYISGWGGGTNFAGVTGNTNGMAVTANAFQPTTNGSDFYLMVLEPGATALEYATFFGGTTSNEHVDGGTSRFNKDLEVYQAVCAGCGGNSDFPTSAGVVSNTNNSSNCNLGAFKMQFDVQTIEANFIAGTSIGCAPFPVTFSNQSTGGVSFLWNFGDGTFDTAFSPTHLYTIADTYKVVLQILDSVSCNIVDTVQHTVITLETPVALVSGDTITCNGSSVPLFASGGTIYSWTPAAGLSSTTVPNPTATPSITTTYKVVVSNAGGCKDSAWVKVTVTTFSAQAGFPSAFCEGTGGSQLLGSSLGGAAPYYYTWWCDSVITFCGLDSVYDNDPVANPTATTKYYLQITDGNGCISLVDSVIVTVKANPIADAGKDIFICHDPGPGANLNGTVTNSAQAPGPYIYQWTPGSGLNDSTILNPYARPDTTTIYTLVITSSGNGCTSKPTTTDTLSSVAVNVKPLPVADAGPDRDLCLNDSVKLPGKGFGAGPVYHYEWSPATGLSDSAIAAPYASPPYTFAYFLTVWSNKCPSYADTVILNIHTLPTAIAGADLEICLGDSIQLDAKAGGDSTSPYYTYSWNPSTDLSDSSLKNPWAGPDSTTTYYLKATTSWGCESSSDSITVWLKPTPVADAGPSLVICDSTGGQLLGGYYYASTDSADTSQIFYSWTPGGDLNDSLRQKPWVFPSKSAFYFLTVQYNSCITYDSVLVTMHPGLNAGLRSDTSIICGGDSVQFTSWGGVGNASFTWIPASGLSNPASANPKASPGDSTTYSLIISEGGCSDTLILLLNVLPSPVISALHSDDWGCVPHTVSFLGNAANALSWKWNFGDGSGISNQQDPLHTWNQPGVYDVLLTCAGLGNCKASEYIAQVNVYDTAHAEFSSDPSWPVILQLPETRVSFFEKVLNSAGFFWDFGDGMTSERSNPDHSFANEGEYFVTLTVISPEGCVSQRRHGPYIVEIPELFIPNVFSPDGDGSNDEFRVVYSGSQTYSLRVFDRWGVSHFFTRNKMESWSGKSESGKELTEGVYYFALEIGGKGYAGTVTLMR